MLEDDNYRLSYKKLTTSYKGDSENNMQEITIDANKYNIKKRKREETWLWKSGTNSSKVESPYFYLNFYSSVVVVLACLKTQSGNRMHFRLALKLKSLGPSVVVLKFHR